MQTTSVMWKFTGLLLAIFGGASLIACGRGADRKSDAPVAPDDLRIVFGEGGGFAGTWTGFTVEPDGRLMRWHGPVAEADASEVGSLSTAEMDAAWEWIRSADFFAAPGDDAGNLTAFVRVETGEQQHRVRFSPGTHGLEEARGPVDDLYRKLLAVAQRHTG